jgi:hypothetical protein
LKLGPLPLVLLVEPFRQRDLLGLSERFQSRVGRRVVVDHAARKCRDDGVAGFFRELAEFDLCCAGGGELGEQPVLVVG